MRYYVGVIVVGSPNPHEGHPPVSMYWSPVTAESPVQAQHQAEPALYGVVAPGTPLEILARRQWTRAISDYGEHAQQHYEVAEVVHGNLCNRRTKLASSPHEAVEDVDGVLAELPRSAPPRLFHVRALIEALKVAPPVPPKNLKPREEMSLEKVLAMAGE